MEKRSTLHREIEVGVVGDSDGSESSDDMEDAEYMEKLRQRRKPPPPRPPPPHKPTVSQKTSACKKKSVIDELEQQLLEAQGLNTSSIPDMMKIIWYHPVISRHVAESLLLSKQTPDGTYLLRNSSTEEWCFTLSVRYDTSVKHYRLAWDGKHLCFGLGRFKNTDELIDHFSSQPVVSGETGVLVYLRHPYPRRVTEPIEYEEPIFSEGLDAIGLTDVSQTPTSNLSINSKEGYLTKQGFHVKSWKCRWFKLFRNQLSYQHEKHSVSPLRVIDLSDASIVARDDSTGRPHCFRLVTSYRTFFFQASSEGEANEWVAILRWKLNHSQVSS